MARQILRACYR